MRTNSLEVRVDGPYTDPMRYAVEVLRRELGELGVAVKEADSQRGQLPRLTLKVGRQPGLERQGFEVNWQPAVDAGELFDPVFSFSPEVAAERMEVGMSAEESGGRIIGHDEAGLLYGVIEFADRCRSYSGLPTRPLQIRRCPRLELRSTGLLMMKRGSYLNSIHEGEFPWFYNRDWWTRYLDRLAVCRFNAVTLWNFHPFPFFCQVPGFPEVKEVDSEQMDRNAAMLRWLCEQFKRRSMTLLFHFYNVYVCRSFAKAHGIDVTLPKRTPLIDRYTRAAIGAFVEAFPEVGLVACVGEGVPGGEAEKFAAEVLLEGVRQTSHRPRFILRQWSTLTPERTREHILGKYENLLTMIKHNAEHIAGTVPDARIRDWTALGVPVVVNFHMLSEVDPFRWAPPAYIRQCCLHYQALGVEGVHIYPRWSWRVPEVGEKGLNQDEVDRDWLYYEAWGRYAFEPVRDEDEELRYWLRRFEQRGMSRALARAALTFYERTGPTLPRLQQHLWVHYDNHFVLTAGLTLGQLRLARSMHSRKIIRTDILDDLRPLRFDIQDRQPAPEGFHFTDALDRSAAEADAALEALRSVESGPGEELPRLRADAEGIAQTAIFYRLKAQAAREIYQFGLTGDLSRLEAAMEPLRESVEVYRRLADEMEQWYEGISDVPPLMPICDYHASHRMPYTWRDCLPPFEQELRNVETVHRIASRGSRWSVCHCTGVYDDDQIPQLVRSLTSEGGPWLVGNPDFLPWPWNFDRLEHVVVMPSNSIHIPSAFGISFVEAGEALRQWVHQGGRIVFYTHPSYRWFERWLLATLLELPKDQVEPQRCQMEGACLIGLDLPGRWTWRRSHNGLGISGQTPLGQGLVEIEGLAVSSDHARQPLTA